MVNVEDQGSVRVVRLDRAAKRNALDAGLAAQLTDALEASIADDMRAVVLTGTGEAFCAGVDLDYLAAIARGEADSSPILTFNRTLQRFPLPVIAAVNGVAVGVGTTLCLHVDLVIAARSARFRTPFTHLGVAPEIGSSWLLPQQVGYQAAAWMLLSSEWIDADQAVRTGLAFEVVDDEELLARALERAEVIAERNPDSVRAAKRTVQAWRQPAIDAAIEIENAEFRRLLAANRPESPPATR